MEFQVWEYKMNQTSLLILIPVHPSKWQPKLNKTREDGTIENAVPFAAPEPGGGSGATPFTPDQFIDATPPITFSSTIVLT